MGKETTSAGQGAVLLTVLGAVSQLLGFGYRVALARMVGAQVMGLYQLLMPMYAVVLSLTAVGLTAAVSNLDGPVSGPGKRPWGGPGPESLSEAVSAGAAPRGRVADLRLGLCIRGPAGGCPHPAGA